MTLKELCYKLLMLAEQEEFTAQIEVSLGLLNDVCGTEFKLNDVVDNDKNYQRVAVFLKLDTKLRLNELELWGSTLDGLKMARDLALDACQAMFTQENNTK